MINNRFPICFGVWLLLFCMIEACSNNSTSPCKNQREGIPALYDDNLTFDTYWIGKITIDELHRFGNANNPIHDTQLFADFLDYKDYTAVLADRTDYSASCFIYTSKPVFSGTRNPLTINSAILKGLQGSDVTLTKTSDGHFSSSITGRAYADNTVSIIVESGNGVSDFPSFSDEIDAPAAPIITRLGDYKSPNLENDLSLGITYDRIEPLSIQWEPSDATYVIFSLKPGAGTDTDWSYLKCIAFDDGCLDVPAEALNYLALDKCTNFDLTFARHNFKYQEIEADGKKAVVLIYAKSSIQSVVIK